MEMPPPDSIFVFVANKLCCVPCAENVKKILLQHTGIEEVDADLEKNTMTVKGTIQIVKLITILQQENIDADLVYYKKQTWGNHHQPMEACDEKENNCFRDEVEGTGANNDMFKDQDQWKEKKCLCEDKEEEEDIGADHYKIRNTFKDHKPEKYVPPKEEYYWGDVRSGMHKRFPVIPRSHFNAGFPNYHGFYYSAPWPQEHYM